ncbi:MAG: FHA domain-containing protein [Deltaproteobacteria bacterium]|nr:FHA domain-containing protein [Deltaproteobacteria bacterium]
MLRIFVALAVLTGIARADDDATRPSFRAVVDRVDLEPSSLTGMRLRVYLSFLSLQGQKLDLDPKNVKLFLGPTEKKAPFAVGEYGSTSGSETAIVFVVQAGADYTEALPLIADALDHEVLAALSDKTQVAVLTYGESPGTGKLGPVKPLRGKLAIGGDASPGDPALLDTVDKALRLLKNAKTEPEGKPIRKLIVVIGDGRDKSGDKDRITRAGQRAGKEGVRIHTIAYSPSDNRRPMLALGELSKRSLGTLRWVRKDTADSWKATFDQLRDEIDKQYVLTYFLDPGDEAAGRKLHVTMTGRLEVASNELKVPDASCAGAACDVGYCADDHCLTYRAEGGGHWWKWLLTIGGGVVGLLVLLGFIGYLMQRKQRPQTPAVPGQPVVAPPAKAKAQAPVVQPGLLPNGRPIPAFLIMSGPRTGERLLLHNGFLVGKQPGCHLLIEDGYTSSQHAQVYMDGEGNVTLFDRQSTNGTFVNGNRITALPLQHGASIRIGSTELRFLAQ